MKNSGDCGNTEACLQRMQSARPLMTTMAGFDKQDRCNHPQANQVVLVHKSHHFGTGWFGPHGKTIPFQQILISKTSRSPRIRVTAAPSRVRTSVFAKFRLIIASSRPWSMRDWSGVIQFLPTVEPRFQERPARCCRELYLIPGHSFSLCCHLTGS